MFFFNKKNIERYTAFLFVIYKQTTNTILQVRNSNFNSKKHLLNWLFIIGFPLTRFFLSFNEVRTEFVEDTF